MYQSNRDSLITMTSRLTPATRSLLLLQLKLTVSIPLTTVIIYSIVLFLYYIVTIISNITLGSTFSNVYGAQTEEGPVEFIVDAATCLPTIVESDRTEDSHFAMVTGIFPIYNLLVKGRSLLQHY